MRDEHHSRPHDVGPQRRTFLGRLAAATAALGLAPWTSHAATLDAHHEAGQATEPWMKRLTGANRVVFHAHEPTGGLALRWAQTFLDTQKSSYGRVDSDSSVVVGLNGKSVGLLFNDAIWAKYPIGQTLALPGVVNPLGPSGSNIVSQLLARGVIILACQNSLRAAGQRFLPEPARADAAARTAFGAEVAANLLPGVETVPAMVVTLQMAQERGCRYVYAGG
ncbi:MAG: twin-arginine translocation signal domain-containing protein [Gemmatimonadaceae bacterium]|nr:twin-arginine translocation signal domain-containing protein [Gemmatimonadaceae bacterium]